MSLSELVGWGFAAGTTRRSPQSQIIQENHRTTVCRVTGLPAADFLLRRTERSDTKLAR